MTIVSEQNLKKLRSAFNLNIYEVKIWTSLLSKGVATAGELSEITNVPRSRAYDVLESLEKRGFIIMKLGRPIKYLAVSPEEIIKRVKKDHEEKAKREIKSLEEVKNTEVFNELSLLFSNGIDHISPDSIAGTFKSRRSIYNQMQSLISNAKDSVLIVTTEDGLLRKLNEFKTEFKKSKAKIKILAPLNSKNSKDAAKELNETVKVKHFSAKARFLIADSSEILMILNNGAHESTEIGIWTKSPFFAEALNSLVENSLRK